MEELTTLDVLAADPERAASLLPDARAALLAKALAVVGALAAPALVNAPSPTLSRPERVVRIREAAGMLGRSVDHLHRTWRKIPGAYRDADGRVKFPVSAIERYIRSQGRR